MNLYFGLDELVGGWERYKQRYNLLEHTNHSKKPPTLKTLNQWRVNTPKGFAFVVHASNAISNEMCAIINQNDNQVSLKLSALWEETTKKCVALGAKAILLETPPEFTPSSNSRILMREIAHSLGRQQRAKIIWHPYGLWEPVSTRDLAESYGLIFALDPFLFSQEGNSFTHGDACFVVNERAGARRQFDSYDFEEMLEWGQVYQRLFVLLRGRFKDFHGRELANLVNYLEPQDNSDL